MGLVSRATVLAGCRSRPVGWPGWDRRATDRPSTASQRLGWRAFQVECAGPGQLANNAETMAKMGHRTQCGGRASCSGRFLSPIQLTSSRKYDCLADRLIFDARGKGKKLSTLECAWLSAVVRGARRTGAEGPALRRREPRSGAESRRRGVSGRQPHLATTYLRRGRGWGVWGDGWRGRGAEAYGGPDNAGKHLARSLRANARPRAHPRRSYSHSRIHSVAHSVTPPPSTPSRPTRVLAFAAAALEDADRVEVAGGAGGAAGGVPRDGCGSC